MPNYLAQRFKRSKKSLQIAETELIQARTSNATHRKIATLRLKVYKAQQQLMEDRYLRLVNMSEKAKKRNPLLAEKLENDAAKVERVFTALGNIIKTVKKELETK